MISVDDPQGTSHWRLARFQSTKSQLVENVIPKRNAVL